MPKQALIILHDGVEEMEAIAPIDILRRGGIEVITASISPQLTVTGRSQVTLASDTLLADVTDEEYDCIILPGGPGITQSVRHNNNVKQLLIRHCNAGKWVAGICAAPLVFKDAGLLQHKRYTAHPTTAAELPDLQTGKSVVLDGNLITSAGAGTATAFALEILAALTASSTVAEVAQAICFLEPQ